MFTMSTQQHRRCRSITDFVNAQKAAAQNGFLGGMTVLSIMVTAHQVRWNGVRERIASNPEEVKQLDEHGRTVLYKALSRRMDDYPSHGVVQDLVEANPAAVWEGIVNLYGSSSNGESSGLRNNLRDLSSFPGNTPLGVATWRRASLEILQILVAARPSVPSQDVASLVSLWNSYRNLYGNEQGLVNFLLEGGRESLSVFAKLQCILRYCTVPETSLISLRKGEILHRASSAPKCSVELFQIILQKFPEMIRQQDENGRLPLHSLMTFCSTNNLDTWEEQQCRLKRLRILLEIHSGALMVPDSNGQLPIHLAITSGWHHLNLLEIIKTTPQSLAIPDGVTKLYPFQLAAKQNLPLTTIFKLLLAKPEMLQKQLATAHQTCPKEYPTYRRKDRGTRTTLVTTRVLESTQSKLLVKSQSSDGVPDQVKSLLQHVRAKGNNALWAELMQLLTCHSVTTSGSHAWSALHAAASLAECPLGLIRVLLQMFPEQLDQRSGQDLSTPLHCAARNAAKPILITSTSPATDDNPDRPSGHSDCDIRTTRLQLVLEANPSAAQIRDGKGQLPLHLAAYHSMPIACLEILISAWPDALCQRDEEQFLYPFLWAACSPTSSLSDVFMLLLRAPHVLRSAGLVE